ncbi:MAG: bifunctional UDP-N-acetylglucosamine diphosphorylase/glucosamine-1-phosphate N-acetyltransferase GlmU [Oligoflexia bacterium]|nr:bifunctional UDP-N-acetylglucosamine diphosphorylase/glucosamine-1-phosphate N-acetyltransferase GlmU [Oligoflexia bacterium]
MAKQTTAIVLAAGRGERMKTQKPKVLHAAAGRPLIDHVLNALSSAGVNNIRVVVGYAGDQVRQHLWGKPGIEFFAQTTQLGTADAVKSAQIETLAENVIICCGDTPLVSGEDFSAALHHFSKLNSDVLVVSARVKNPTGLGRIVRDGQGRIKKIVEEKDASAIEKKINEINTGVYVVKGEILKKYLPLITNDNAKKEFYLTDIIKLTLNDKKKVEVLTGPARIGVGVNNQEDLARATRSLYNRKARELMQLGVTIIDPNTTYIDADVTIGAETVIGQGCVISAGTTIGVGCNIEPYCHVRASQIGNRVELRWGTLVDQSEIHESAVVGPYARLRPETIVEHEAHVGNFVELKKTRLGARAKANHLTYLGDAEIGEDTNIGCGTITCNYAVDRKKYKTKIGKNVFVGSDTQFVAPVTVGDGAVIASGSTITEDVPSKALAIARSRQTTKTNYNKES